MSTNFDPRRIVYVMGIPGSNRTSLVTNVEQFIRAKNKRTLSITTSELITYAYRKEGLPEPNFSKILNWDEATERFALQSALGKLDQYINEFCPGTYDIIFVIGHATFPHNYSTYHFRPAISKNILEQLNVNCILQVQYNPRKVAKNNSAGQWNYLGVEHTAIWMCHEYETAKQLASSVNTRFFVVGSDEDPSTIYRMIYGNEPIAYFSYPITGSTEEKEQKKYLKTILEIKKNVEKYFIVAHHGAITLEKEDLQEWVGAESYLRTFQLDMLMPQAKLQIAVHQRKDISSVPEISAGVLAESARANQLGLKTYFVHPRGSSVSPYQIMHSDIVLKTVDELFLTLEKDGYKKSWRD